ncbi:GntR family transcriptional regulator [Pseudomonas syringae]|uniref:GntR family transcriptional regulator n=1 Tax=Pseudomonas syringae pv. papulans TaxID=83963 RepID=A0A0P9YA87_PSESX|nr:GntR family transcriptional regulator [Pseudomonas syringae]KPY30706.1 Transcriptional regulator, GntR family [Pseudomonas syringae pv. papulans]KWS34519.1 GntR family transcriptional regulator [Pseudomonas syringae pv. papulans]MDH4605615.1 GntR family transcriptional regulator [Pseudomonas syringae pv. papulans]MDH4624497.1 GntR family transcriptional regulator [Pseudomonas syringae pv. papulans]RMN38731.1 Transcriptional regulator, GntR family [Pseudomonas syringae pv. papulans]
MNSPNTTNALAEDVYRRLKQEIFDFYLLPYDRFTETQLADRYQVSRTPVRDALYRLQREGYLDVEFRRGWSVKPLDFNQIDQLYDLRIVLECAAVERSCASAEVHPELTILRQHWLIDRDCWQIDMQVVADLDEQFHTQLVAASGNLEMARIHQEVTERIRIVRRLDFFKSARIEHTYLEHAAILNALQARKRDEALLLLRSHVEISKLEVRKLTISMLSDARRRYEA